MTLFLLLWLLAGAACGSALLALLWTVRRGDLRRSDEAARSVYDADEPEGDAQTW